MGSSVTLELDAPRSVSQIRIVLDSDLNRYYRDMKMRAGYFKSDKPVTVAPELVKRFRVEYRASDGAWATLTEETGNHPRLWRASVGPVTATAVRLTTLASWGADPVQVFAFEVS